MLVRPAGSAIVVNEELRAEAAHLEELADLAEDRRVLRVARVCSAARRARRRQARGVVEAHHAERLDGLRRQGEPRRDSVRMDRPRVLVRQLTRHRAQVAHELSACPRIAAPRAAARRRSIGAPDVLGRED